MALHRTVGAVARLRLPICSVQPPAVSNPIGWHVFMGLYGLGFGTRAGVTSALGVGLAYQRVRAFVWVCAGEWLGVVGGYGVDGAVALKI